MNEDTVTVSKKIIVTFLKKQYEFPQDIIEYISLLSLTEDMKDTLMTAFVKKISGSVGVIDSKDLHDNLKKQASKFIEKLCGKGIYSKTIDDYVFDNEGYKLYDKVNKDALDAMKSFLMEDMDNVTLGLETASQNAASTITGSGITVFSNSFLTLAATAAMEYSVLKNQYKKADIQYQRELSGIINSSDKERKKKENDYINTVYIPNMEKALTLFVYNLMDKYIKDLISEGMFNADTLKYVDIMRSQALLQNLKLTKDIKEVLESSFLACPFNLQLYIEVANYELMDNEVFETAKYFGQQEMLIAFLRNKVSCINDVNNFTHNAVAAQKYVHALAVCTEKTDTEIYQIYSTKVYRSVKYRYQNIREMSISLESCIVEINKISDDELLSDQNAIKNKAVEIVRSIINDEDFITLENQCGYTNILCEISPEGMFFETKADIDDYYIGKLIDNFNTLLPERKIDAEKRIREIEEQKRILIKEQEHARAIISKRNKVFKIVLFMLAITPVIVNMLLVSNACNSVKGQINSIISNNMAVVLEESKSDANIIGLTGEYQLQKIVYYEVPGNCFYIVPIVEFCSNQNDIPELIGSSAVKSIINFWQLENGKHIMVPSTISDENFVYCIPNATIIQADGTEISIMLYDEEAKGELGKYHTQINPYFSIPKVILYILYLVILILIYNIYKRKIMRNEK